MGSDNRQAVNLPPAVHGHDGSYKPISYVPSYNELTDKPAEIDLNEAIPQLSGIRLPVMTTAEITALPPAGLVYECAEDLRAEDNYYCKLKLKDMPFIGNASHQRGGGSPQHQPCREWIKQPYWDPSGAGVIKSGGGLYSTTWLLIRR